MCMGQVGLHQITDHNSSPFKNTYAGGQGIHGLGPVQLQHSGGAHHADSDSRLAMMVVVTIGGWCGLLCLSRDSSCSAGRGAVGPERLPQHVSRKVGGQQGCCCASRVLQCRPCMQQLTEHAEHDAALMPQARITCAWRCFWRCLTCSWHCSGMAVAVESKNCNRRSDPKGLPSLMKCATMLQ